MKICFSRSCAHIICLTLILSGLLTTEAKAHLVSTGMGPVYDGIGHLLLTPGDLIPTLAVALYAGLRGATIGRYFLFSFPLAWLAGGALGLNIGTAVAFPLTAVSIILIGIMVAADLRLPQQVSIVVGVLIGIVHGYFNGVTLQAGPKLLGLLGTMGTLFVLLALTSAFVVSLKQPWTRIAVRVLGSWTVAIGILMIGWHFAGGLQG